MKQPSDIYNTLFPVSTSTNFLRWSPLIQIDHEGMNNKLFVFLRVSCNDLIIHLTRVNSVYLMIVLCQFICFSKFQKFLGEVSVKFSVFCLIVDQTGQFPVFLGKVDLEICSKFTEFTLQLYWNHPLAWLFTYKFAAYFQNTL